VRLWSGVTGLFVAAAIAGSPRVVTAQASDANKAAAVALFDEATKLMAEGRHAAACAKFADSNRLDPQLGVLLHLANCYEKNGQIASAWAHWRDAAEIAQARGDARQTTAKNRAAELEAKLSKLVIDVPAGSDVPGLEIKRDGTVVSRALWGASVPVDAGEHVIEASAPGKRTSTAKISVAGNAAVATHTIAALDDEVIAASAPGAPPESPPAASVEADSSSGDTQRMLGWIAGGLGVVGIGAGIVFELQRGSKIDEREGICPSGKLCTPDEGARVEALNEDVDGLAMRETIAFVAGGLLLAGGAVLILTAPSGERTPTGRVMIGPSVARDTLGVWATGSW
jgi:hypothetical protein